MALTISYDHTTVKAAFQTNTFTDYTQYSPDVLGLSNGGFVAAYNNANTIGDDFILLNFYDNNASVVGSEKVPYSSYTSAIRQPSLTQLTNGNVLVVWDDEKPGIAGLRGHLFSPNGTSIGDQLSFSSFNDAHFDDPQVAALAGGGFVISFSYSGDSNVYSRKYNDAGVQQGISHQVNTVATTDVQKDTAVAALADGGFVVTYYVESGGPSRDDVRAAIYNADDSVRTADFFIDISPTDQLDAKVVGLPNGNFAVVYRDTGWPSEAGTSGISLQIRSPTGDLISGVIHVNTSSPTVFETNPDITVLPNGFIVVTWTKPDPGNPADNDIFARVFDQSGHALSFNDSSVELKIAYTITDAIHSAVSHLLGGQFITSWEDSLSDGGGGQIASSVTEITRTTNGDSAADTFVGDQLRDIVDGGGGNDVLYGGGNNDTLHGGGESDSLYGDAGDDVLHGGIGDDYLGGGAGGDGLYGEDGNDTLDGGDAADYLSGEGGTDSLYAGAGNDVMQGGDGADYLDGSSGGDTMYGENDNDVLDGGADLSSDADYMDGGAGNDTLYGRGGNDTMIGGLGFDALIGDTGADYLFGGDGNDYLGGQADGDFMQGGNGDDSMDGGAVADYMEGNDGADSMYGGDGGDVMHGGNDGDYLAGQNGADSMFGEAGNDVIDGGNDSSNDYLDGGAGSDAFIFGAGMGHDVVGTFDDAGANQDLIYISSAIVANFATLTPAMSQNGANVIINLGGFGGIQINGVTLANLGADDFIFY